MARPLQLLRVPTGERVLEILPQLQKALDGSGPALLPVPVGDRAAADRLAAALRADEPLDPGEDDDNDPTALVVATSGSTGDAKGVLLPASALAASAAGTDERLGGSGRWLLALPAQHIAGLQVLLRAARSGTAPVVLDTALPFTATAFLRAAERMPAARSYLSLVPTQLRRVLADPAAREALTGFTSVLVGGAATAPEVLMQARSAGVAVVTTYGMSETCGGCVYDGVPLRGVQVILDDPSGGGPAGQLAPGRVRITGPVIGRGYRGRPGDPSFEHGTARAFVTSDLGRLVDGRLEILGRADDVIVTGGTNVAPQAVEAVLSGLPGVAEVVVIGVPDPDWGQRVVAVIVPTAGPVLTLARARDAVTAALGSAAAPRALHSVSEIPLRGPGKPDRRAVSALIR